MSFIKVAVFLSLSAFCTSIFASSMQIAEEALGGENFERALGIAVPLAEDGDANAMMLLARMYDQGLGVEKDSRYSLELITKASDEGHEGAQYILGKAHAEGSSVPQDIIKATSLLIGSAEKGNINAMRFLALSYSTDGWNEYNAERWVKLLEASAKLGDSVSSILLARAYEEGEYLQVDKRKAFNLYKEIAEKETEMGNVGAIARLRMALMYHAGEGVPQNYRESLYWLLNISESKESWFFDDDDIWMTASEIAIESQLSIASIYLNGNGVTENRGEVAHWYRRAAENGHPPAMHLLGDMYKQGGGVPKDESMAYTLYSLAVARGYEYSLEARDETVKNLELHQLNRAQSFTSSWEVEEIIPMTL